MAVQKDRLDLTGGAMRAGTAEATGATKRSFPANAHEQTAAVLTTLAEASGPVTPTALAAAFRQGRRALPQIEAVLAALVRIGGLVHTSDGGHSFTARRAA